MRFRTSLYLIISAAVLLAVAVAGGISQWQARRSFESLDRQRADALVNQLQTEMERRAADLTARTETLARSETVLRIAAAARPQADMSTFFPDAPRLAAENQLDILELVSVDGGIISSAHWPGRFGYKAAWRVGTANSSATLHVVGTPHGEVLALVSVRAVRAGSGEIILACGRIVDQAMITSLSVPVGTRLLVYRALGKKFSGPAADAPELLPLLERTREAVSQNKTGGPERALLRSTRGLESAYTIPLLGEKKRLLAIVVVASSMRPQLELERTLRWASFVAVIAGVLLGLLLSAWLAARITKPVEQLAAVVADVAAGEWRRNAEVSGPTELEQLAADFNHMTRQLITQREKLLQSERVAAWRVLARRLAHELKNPLFPLQITVENLVRARESAPDEFDEIFRESTATLLSEIANLKSIVASFTDFARMPTPDLQLLHINDLVGEIARLFEPQLARQQIRLELQLADDLEEISADPALMRRAIENLVLNAIDAMAAGGTLRLRTIKEANTAVLEVSDTGVGLTPEECERLFTPYYTTKQHGTGLGLAIVQSVVSDHGGTISVVSEKGRGATFRIVLRRRSSERTLSAMLG